MNNDQTLNRALEYAVTNLDHNVMTLLISAGANINEINNSIGNVILQYKIASEASSTEIRTVSKIVKKNVV
ncbi:hypothetical protein [Wolbachia endosymbiont (group B) of Camptogramma bilineatum]|uniref:hypothetical protein n=1 Tax=Wolbachia endosymbiont (group B) of Camptogramma bilineatum TaxID=2953991 RepID=UPI00223237E2|nr:hypothetical protein [Wolbachia endosymbiont (group B) of Camptogramma bilineatum]